MSKLQIACYILVVVLLASSQATELSSQFENEGEGVETGFAVAGANDQVTFGLNAGNGNYCVVVSANFSITFTYIGGKQQTYSLGQPLNVTGYCNVTGQNISGYIMTGSGQFITATYKDMTLSFLFNNTNTEKKNMGYSGPRVYLHVFSYPFNDDNANSSSYLLHGKTDWAAPKDKFYQCQKTLPVALTGFNTTSLNASLAMIGTFYAAVNTYQKNVNQTFSQNANSYVCDEDFSDSNLVPIIVGCALAALVLIVLVAYFVGRCHQRGQEEPAYQPIP